MTTAKLSATEKNLVLVLLGGDVSHPRSVSALAEKGLVVCGDHLTARGREAAYKVLAERMPSQTKNLRAELLKAAAYAKKGQVAPDEPEFLSWNDKSGSDGWYWVEGERAPVYIEGGELIGSIGASVDNINSRRVCKIPSRPR